MTNFSKFSTSLFALIAGTALMTLTASCADETADRAYQAETGISPAETISDDKPPFTISTQRDFNDLFECLEASQATIVSAHRGGPSKGFPENAIETFANTLDQVPALVEFDVATTSDGVLILMHDDTLDRTTTGSGLVTETSFADIQKLNLVDENGTTTSFRVPRFSDAMAFLKNRTITQIDFKRSTRYEDVIEEVRAADAGPRVVLIAYSMAAAAKLHRLAPEMMISLSIDTQSELNSAVAADIPEDRLVGFTGTEDPQPRLFSLLNDRDVEVIFGTLGGRSSFDVDAARTGDDSIYTDLARNGVDIIATDRPVAAHKELAKSDRDSAGKCGVSG
ncbi:MAG: glycerophosphodiester phosphodiesterase family protein [Pseudomonadota bacterium]